MNLVLTGYRAAGKTTVGRKVSSYSRRAFVDSDDVIEKKQGTTIKDIVKCHGWDYFRAIEREVISEVSKYDNLIISIGGGAIIDQENVKVLQRNGLIIWLKADVEVLLERMNRDMRSTIERPSLTGKGTLTEFKKVLIQREPLYERASEAHVDTSLLDVDGVAHQVLSIFEERLVRV